MSEEQFHMVLSCQDEGRIKMMKANGDTIQFESRCEVGEFIKILEKYVDAYPKERNNETVRKMYKLLDEMEMCW